MLFRAAVAVALLLLFVGGVALGEEPAPAPSPTPLARVEWATPIPTPTSKVHPTCCSPFCSPSWASDPERTTTWIELNGGAGGTNSAQGSMFGMALGLSLEPHRLFRASWTEYVDNGGVGRNPSDHFDTFSVQYGARTRAAGVLFSAAGGLGYSRGYARGDLLFATNGARWYRPTQYDAISLTGNVFAGIAGKLGAIGITAAGDANPVRQSWGAQLTIAYGPILDLSRGSR